MSLQELEERKWEIHKQIESLHLQREDCDSLQKNIDYLEEESGWQNKIIKETNDNLYDSYPNDRHLRNLLVEKEELLMQKISDENRFFEECRELIREQRKIIDAKREDFEEELLSIQKREEEEHDENHIHTNTSWQRHIP